jgi:hypothetical protein
MSFWSNGVDWVRSLRKIQQQVVLFQKSLQRTSRASFAPFFRRKPKVRKRNKHEFWVKRGGLSFATLFHRKPKLPKRNKHEFWVKRGGLGAFVAKNSTACFLFQKLI